MKLSGVVVFSLLGAATAAPTPTLNQASTGSISKRAFITETCTIGYASTNGGAISGKGVSTTTVSTLAQFTKAAESSGKLNIIVKGSISGSTKVRVASDKTIVRQKGSRITGASLYIKGVSNVIIRNLAISKVKEAYGDAIGIKSSKNVWVNHVDISSDMSSRKDYYNRLINITKVRFGTVHIYNNYYNKVGSTGINTRMGAQVRVESSVFKNSSKKVILSADLN
ncbi:pectate lyase B [Colletotrichum fioriniae PJ7]|uniref:Pectate lyase B n=1 Tax=Colletotrichum fioriniae PJ7 TaxID=1445577 RepID=A0A010RAF9_9PEZI|nr:pectate lyase B [Colletotrichum fioriniae PJ7]